MYRGRIGTRTEYQDWRATPVLFESRATARLITCQFPTVEDHQRNITMPLLWALAVHGATLHPRHYGMLHFTKYLYEKGALES